MKRNKLWSVLATGALVGSLAACGSDSSDSSGSGDGGNGGTGAGPPRALRGSSARPTR